MIIAFEQNLGTSSFVEYLLYNTTVLSLRLTAAGEAPQYTAGFRWDLLEPGVCEALGSVPKVTERASKLFTAMEERCFVSTGQMRGNILRTQRCCWL